MQGWVEKPWVDIDCASVPKAAYPEHMLGSPC